jgi:hypothetical protein
MTKEIVVEIKPDGSVVVEGKGFVGAECTKATKYIEEQLGVKTSFSKKAEYKQTGQQQKAGQK